MRAQITSRVAGCLALLLLIPAAGRAQTPATSFKELPGVVRPGEKVTVTQTDGRRIRGRMVSLDQSFLVVAPDRRWFRRPPQQTVLESSAASMTLEDPTWQGGAAGFAVGYGLGALSCLQLDEYDRAYCPLILLLYAPFTGLLGSAVGELVDAAIHKTIFSAPPFRTPAPGGLAVAPIVGWKRAGVRLSVAF